MRHLVVLFIHFIATLARLLGPGGVRSLVAESLLLKHQLQILNRGRKRAPNLSAEERFIAGLCTLLMNSAFRHRPEAIHSAASPPRAGQTKVPHIVLAQPQASAWPERTE